MGIGKLKPVPIREIWPHESRDFTQWLAKNVNYLCDEIELDLSVLAVEKKLDDSRYTIDILAQDDDGRDVIIENQIEESNHKHLGQVLTYAVNMSAKIAIWITSEPRTEHIEVVNWLNKFTDKDFYLVQLEVYKIGDSDPAPVFSVICEPSETSRSMGEASRELEPARKENRARRRAADTIVVPAKQEGFEKVFLGENRWHSIRIRESRIPQLKYIASYQVDPISAVTYTAEIKKIVPSPYEEKKWLVEFKGPAKKLKNKIPRSETYNVQSPFYCQYTSLESAKDVDDLLRLSEPNAEEAA